MSFIASLRKIPKWQLSVTGGLLFWAAALQVSAAATLPCIQLTICMRWTLCRSVVKLHTTAWSPACWPSCEHESTAVLA